MLKFLRDPENVSIPNKRLSHLKPIGCRKDHVILSLLHTYPLNHTSLNVSTSTTTSQKILSKPTTRTTVFTLNLKGVDDSPERGRIPNPTVATTKFSDTKSETLRFLSSDNASGDVIVVWHSADGDVQIIFTIRSGYECKLAYHQSDLIMYTINYHAIYLRYFLKITLFFF